MNKKLSVVVPVFNESGGIKDFHQSLTHILKRGELDYELIYCDDGSSDDTYRIIKELSSNDKRVKLVRLSRNFGKELATTAGLHIASGDAIITIDGDGQHPVELIPEFVARWQAGSKIVTGLRTKGAGGFMKNLSSRFFYWVTSRVGGIRLTAGATDFRLIDKSVQQEFSKMTERNRITRGLVEWLGYEQDFVEFRASPRLNSKATYSYKKLFKLAIDSIISLSVSPLYITAYIGAIVLPGSVLMGTFMIINAAVGDPAHLHAKGSAYLLVFALFLIGMILVNQSIIGLYLSHIHAETQNRPLYIVDKNKSVGL